jgi:hypothetical protein
MLEIASSLAYLHCAPEVTDAVEALGETHAARRTLHRRRLGRALKPTGSAGYPDHVELGGMARGQGIKSYPISVPGANGGSLTGELTLGLVVLRV